MGAASDRCTLCVFADIGVLFGFEPAKAARLHRDVANAAARLPAGECDCFIMFVFQLADRKMHLSVVWEDLLTGFSV